MLLALLLLTVLWLLLRGAQLVAGRAPLASSAWAAVGCEALQWPQGACGCRLTRAPRPSAPRPASGADGYCNSRVAEFTSEGKWVRDYAMPKGQDPLLLPHRCVAREHGLAGGGGQRRQPC